ncbi:MAG: bi-domain-containing oxidoreductase [Nitrospinae bacterium]|nr:bi-domain-containing oxidoreductase [Nitrospinota bacterium]
MKQVLIKRGQAVVEDVPASLVEEGEILVEVAYSLISPGTEGASVSSSGESLLRKVINQPLNVLKVIDIAKTHGISKTRSIIKGSLESGYPIGYSCSGIVVKTGNGVVNIKPGDRVACAGAGRANHAEVVLVPRNLCVKIPDECDISDAASVTLGAIAMQGVRRADVKLGEKVAVIGLGLIGQITVQLLKIAGCRVMGIDIDNERVELAKKLGMDWIITSPEDALNLTGRLGVDSTIITASSSSSEIIQQAIEMTRKKGKVVVVGDVGLGIKRSPFYEKEIDLLISCSYGPGRYDRQYEDGGIDYPYPYVRWTENRNMEEYLRLIAEGKFNFKALVDRVYSIDEAPKAYEDLKGIEKRPLGILLEYPVEVAAALNQVQGSLRNGKLKTKVELKPLLKDGKINVAVIGVGSFARAVHLPNLQKLSNLYNVSAIITKKGSSAKEAAKQFDASYSSTDYTDVLNDKDIDMVLIATRHNLHANITLEALKEGKAVFVEKPLALNRDELNNLKSQISNLKSCFMVGFNRRFSPAAVRVKELISNRQNPLIVNYRVNAGYIPLDNWIHTVEGGGRIIGEACHMFDFFNFLTDSEVKSIDASAISPKTSHVSARDNFTSTIKYKEGSICTLTYTSLGSGELGKEYIEIYFDGKTCIIDDFKKLKVYGSKEKGWSSVISDKGHINELTAFEKFIRGNGGIPIPLRQIFQTTDMSLIVDEMICAG